MSDTAEPKAAEKEPREFEIGPAEIMKCFAALLESVGGFMAVKRQMLVDMSLDKPLIRTQYNAENDCVEVVRVKERKRGIVRPVEKKLIVPN